MKTKTGMLLGLIAVLLLLTARVEASTVSFVSNPTVSTGQTFTLDLIGTEFTDIVDGGGVNLFFDSSVLGVNRVTVDTSVWEWFDDPGTIDNTAGTVSELQFASFIGVTGDFAIATIEFSAIGAGISDLILTESTLNPFASDGLPLDPSVTFLTSSVTAVPLPTAFWLLLSGLGMFGMLKKYGKQKYITASPLKLGGDKGDKDGMDRITKRKREEEIISEHLLQGTEVSGFLCLGGGHHRCICASEIVSSSLAHLPIKSLPIFFLIPGRYD